MRHRPGGTLIELLVTLAIMAIVASVVTLSLRLDAGATDDVERQVMDARRTALRTGRPVTVHLVVRGEPATMTAFPDGGVAPDTALSLHRLTGERFDAGR